MIPARRRRRLQEWPTRFLEDFAKTGNVTESAHKVGVSRQTVYDRRAADHDFEAAMDSAEQCAVDALEHEARRRAVKGTLEPVFYQGAKCGAVRRYSDSLLTLLMKAGRPEKYRENATVRHESSVGVVPIREVVIERRDDDEPV